MGRPRKINSIEISRTKQDGFRYVVSAYGGDGKRVRSYFDTKQAAEAHREAIFKKWSAPELALEPTPQEKVALRLAREKGIDLVELLKEALAIKERAARESPVTVSELAKMWLAALETAGRGERHINGTRSSIDRAVAAAGDMRVAAATPEWVATAIAGDGSRSLTTKANYRRMLHGFFAFAMERKIRADNPASEVKSPRVMTHSDDIAILTPEQARRLIAATASVSPEILPAVAIGLFAGLRNGEIQRLSWDDVRVSRGMIVVAAGKAKTGNRRIVAIQPVLEALLCRGGIPPASGPVFPKNGPRMWDRASKAAGWRGHKCWAPKNDPDAPPWPANALRHSFVSYHVAAFNDSARTALEAGHSQDMLFKHYRQLATEDEAEEFWTMGLLEVSDPSPPCAAASD